MFVAMVAVLVLAASACGHGGPRFDKSRDPDFEADERFIEEHREAAMGSLYMAVVPPVELASGEPISARHISRALMVNEFAALLAAGELDEDYDLAPYPQIVARYNVRHVYQVATDWVSLDWNIENQERFSRLLGNDLFFLAAVQANVVEVVGGDVEVVWVSPTEAEIRFMDSDGKQTVIALSDNERWGLDLFDAMGAHGSLDHPSDPSLRNLMGILGWRTETTFARPYNVASITLRWHLDPRLSG